MFWIYKNVAIIRARRHLIHNNTRVVTMPENTYLTDRFEKMPDGAIYSPNGVAYSLGFFCGPFPFVHGSQPEASRGRGGV